VDMKGLLTTIFYFLLVTAYSQTVVLGNYSKSVPDGKKWILPTGKEILIEVSNGTLRSGNMCNALMLSSPRIIGDVVVGDYGSPDEVYSIIFNELYEAAYSNHYTFSIVPVSIVDSKFSLQELQYYSIENVGSKQIIFYPGQEVYVGECLKNLQLFEFNLTPKELAEIMKKKDEAKLVELNKRQDEENKRLKQIEDEENKKLIAEQERRDRIINSSHFFNANELTNESEVKLNFQKEAIPIFYEYLMEFKVKFKSSFEDKIAKYKRNVSYSGKDDYSMFTFSFFFDKQGGLKRITNNNILIDGEGVIDVDVDISWFEKLKPFISLNKGGSIKVDDKDYIVNSYCLTFFNIYESTQNNTTQISVSKKGDIVVLSSNTSHSSEKLIDMIKTSSFATGLSKGKYLVTDSSDKISLRFSYFENYDSKASVTSDRETHSIVSIDKL